MNLSHAKKLSGPPAVFDLGPYELSESLLWTVEEGFFIMDYHMRRIMNAGKRCGVDVHPWRAQHVLHNCVSMAGGKRLKVRLRIAASGLYRADAKEIPLTPEYPAKVCWTRQPIDSSSPYLFYKTTNRDVYDGNLAANPDMDDVFLYNERGEVTESCWANIVIEKDGRRLTPDVRCGLLGGTFRQSLLDAGEIEEAVLTREDVEKAERVFLVNSVRKWRPAKLQPR